MQNDVKKHATLLDIRKRGTMRRGANAMPAKDKKTRPVTLRDFPDELYWRAKTCASSRHMHFKAYVIAALEEATQRDFKNLSRPATKQA
jgi:hypothetical protein